MKYINIILISLVLLIGTMTAHAQSSRYVKPVATGNGSGSSWANASDDLQAMINASATGNNIYVAAGTYKPIRRADNLNVITPNDRDNAFVLKTDINLYGGYPVEGPYVRDIIANPTILSGDIGVLNDSTDNCYHVVLRVWFPGDTRLDGFIIRDGNANETSHIVVDGEVILRGKGGGVYTLTRSTHASSYEEFKAFNCTFVNNAAIQGGGIYNGGFFRTNCSVVDCSFLNNAATSGGGVYNGGYSRAKFTANRCKFINNTATDNGGGLSNSDNNDLGDFNVSNSIFNENYASIGGGVYNGVSSNGYSSAKLRNCNLTRNTAIEGSSVYTINNISPSDFIIMNSIIWGNNITNGDLVNNGGTLTVSTSIVENGYTGTANSDLDPLFLDAPNGDFTLQINSPAINMGAWTNYSNGNLDLAGNSRMIGPELDAGAYESPYGVITPDAAGIVYVNKHVVGGNRNGHNWLNAAPELADALVAAKTNPNITQIWVAQGTYKPLYSPATSTFGTNQNRSNAFLLVNNVKVYGGFQNANETNINQRDTVNLNTILSGLRASEKCFHVVISAGPVGEACIDGFIIEDGHAYYANEGSSSVDGYWVTVAHGGGIHIIESNPTIKNCEIIDNRGSSGGGIYCFESPTLSIVNCRISNNLASNGGGIYNNRSSPLIENCIISNNSTFSGGEGGGIFTTGNMAYLTIYINEIKNSVITGNTAPTGAGVFLKSRMDVRLTNCTIADNSGNGAVYSENNTYCTVGLHNTILWDNTIGLVPGSGTNSYTSFNSLIQDRNDFPDNGNLNGLDIANDPLFTDVSGEDFTLMPCSPAVNAGSNSEYTLMGGDLTLDKDLSNNPRLFEGTIDMGAYELQTPVVSQIVPSFTQLSPMCFGTSFSLPTLSDNGVIGTWSPAPNNQQTTTYTFTPNPGPCIATDVVNMTVTIDPLDNASFDYATTVVCTEDIIVSPSNIDAPGGTFTSQPGLEINAGTGEIDVAASEIGTYTITYTVSEHCPNYSTTTFTINDLPDASFTYPYGYYCTSSANPSPIVTGTIGAFSATPSGLVINPTTGEINLSASTEGVYEITNLISASGNCPSDAETVSLSVETSPIATISFSEGVLTANSVSGATYQWINCANGNPILGETDVTFTPTVFGSYAVVITTGNCSTESTCETVSFLSLTDQSTEMLKIYPNPTNGLLHVSSSILVDVTILTMDGKVIQLVENAEMIDLTDVANGIYLASISDKDGEFLKMERIVVSR